MMFRRKLINLQQERATSIIEYIVLTIIVLSALYIMKDTISQGLFSKYRQTSESLSFTRQYDAKRTVVCKQDVLSYTDSGTPVMGPFYDESCYHARVMRPAKLNGQAWDAVAGGCPACDLGNTPDSKACFDCENAIKNQCAIESSYCSR